MTTYPRLIYFNFWRKGTAMTASPVADAQHPVSDSQIDTKSMYFEASAKTSPCIIPMNLGVGTISINFIAVLGHNFPTKVILKFQEDTVNNFAHPTDTPNFAYNATNIFQFLATPLTEQYLRLHVATHDAGNFPSEPQVGTILCGSYVEFNRRPIKGYTRGPEDITEIEESDSRVIFAQEKDTLDEFKYNFEALDDATQIEILAFLEECRKNRGFVWCTNYRRPNSNSHFVRNSEITYPTFQYPDVWKWGISMKEIV